MKMDKLWEKSGGINHLETIEAQTWRMVEDQNRSSTRKLVDTEKEHEILEQMIEEDKPYIKFYNDEYAFKGLHYLLFTPFRYPPLKEGTRFGVKTERNLFYSSLELETAMYEKAFYRLSFLQSSEGNIGGKTIHMTAFKVNISTQNGIDLTKPPFKQYRDKIASATSYQDSQMLGRLMRTDKVEAFITYSARQPDNGKNLNLFSPKAFGQNKALEKTFQIFNCYSTKNTVEFYSNDLYANLSAINSLVKSVGRPYVFTAEMFHVNGSFPLIQA